MELRFGEIAIPINDFAHRLHREPAPRFTMGGMVHRKTRYYIINTNISEGFYLPKLHRQFEFRDKVGDEDISIMFFGCSIGGLFMLEDRSSNITWMAEYKLDSRDITCNKDATRLLLKY
jgi:hypothetical protein